MSALYVMRYVGQAGMNAGAVCIGKGRVLGVDAANGRYNGTYTEQNGRIRGTINLSVPGGGTLVTGQAIQAGQQVQITADWPSNFANGQQQQVTVAGRTVSVTFEKLGDVP